MHQSLSLTRLLVFIFFVSLCFLAVLEVLSFRVSWLNKLFYMQVVVFVSLSFFLRHKIKKSYFFGVLVLFGYLALMIFVSRNNTESLYLYSDSLLVLASMLFFLFFGLIKDYKILRLGFLAVFWVMFLSFLFNFVYPIERVNDRFPALNLYYYLLFLLFCCGYEGRSKNLSSWLIVVAICFFVVVVSFYSGDRTFFLISALIFVSAVATLFQFKIGLIALFGGVFLLTSIMLALDLGSKYRVFDINNLMSDHSFMQRFYEASDVVFYIKDSYSKGGYEWLLGYGPGSTYLPIISSSPRNLLSDGSVHHIHSTPFVFLYRFGLVGFLAWCAFVLYVSYIGIRAFFVNRDYWMAPVVILLLVDQMLRNVLVNPGFFLLSSYIFFYKRRW